MKSTKRAAEGLSSPLYFFYNLGCPKNLVDAESAAGALEAYGWMRAEGPARADLLVITTCAFISAAEEESVDLILEVASAKEDRQLLAVLGCLVGREGGRLEELLPEVDIFLDVDSMEEIGRIATEAFSGDSARQTLQAPRTRQLFTPGHYAYLKIADGCSNACSYCTIPSIRGELRSAGARGLFEEAAELARWGVRELVLVAQDTTAWMNERGNSEGLQALIERLSEIEGLSWIRLMYAHPARTDAEALVRLFEDTKLIPYLDMPIQHVADRLLRLMGRGYGRERIERILEGLRECRERVVLRTTVMTGFPGETEEEHEELLDFLERWRIDHVGVFPWSPERGTGAYDLPGRVRHEVVQRRLDEISELQMGISEDLISGMEGERIEVLVDRVYGDEEIGGEDAWGEGRWYGQAPEIDGSVILSGDKADSGDIVKADVRSSGSYDLFAESLRDFN